MRETRGNRNRMSLPVHGPTSVAGQNTRVAITSNMANPNADLLNLVGDRQFGTILADPPWRFQSRTGKVAPEHRRLSRYGTLTMEQIGALPVAAIATEPAHLYMWVPNALLPDGLKVLEA